VAGDRTRHGPILRRKTISLTPRKAATITEQIKRANKNRFRRDRGGGLLMVVATRIIYDSNAAIRFCGNASLTVQGFFSYAVKTIC